VRARVYPFAPPPNGSDRDRARHVVAGIRRDTRWPMALWRARCFVRDHWFEMLLIALVPVVSLMSFR
jgi:hypothetical protein